MRVDEFRRMLGDIADVENDNHVFGRVERRARRLQGWRIARRATVVVLLVGVVGLGVISLRDPSRGVSHVATIDMPADGAQAGTALFMKSNRDDRVLIYDLATGRQRTRTLPGLTGGDPPFPFLVRGDRLVYWGKDGDTSGFAAFSVPLDFSRRPQLIDHARFFVPSVHPDRLWLVDDSGNGTARGSYSVREVTAAGVETVPRTPLPTGTYPERGAADDTLVLEQDRQLVLWSPRNRMSEFAIEAPVSIDANANAIAWVAHDRALNTHLGMLKFPTAVRSLRGDFGSGALSPDGTRLAVLIDTGRTGGSSLAMINTKSGAHRLISGSRIPPGGDVGWAPDGATVIFTGYAKQPRVTVSVAAYTLGSPAARRIPAAGTTSTKIAVGISIAGSQQGNDRHPATTAEQLSKRLSAAGRSVTREPSTGAAGSFFRANPVTICIDHSPVQVYEYSSLTDRLGQSKAIQPDGSLRYEEGKNTRVVIPEWVATPHFYAAGRLLVTYLGDDDSLVRALTAILGPSITTNRTGRGGSNPAC